MSLHAISTLRGRSARRLGVFALAFSAMLVFWAVAAQVAFAQVVPPPPPANPRSATTAEDTAVTIDTGIQADPRYAVAISAAPAHGAAAQGPGVFPSNFNIVYTPGANQAGTVTFSYQICTLPPDNPIRCGQSAQVTVTITEVNDGPQADADSATVQFGQSVLINVLDGDNGGPNEPTDTVTLVAGGVSAPVPNGTAVIENGQIRYTAPAPANPCVPGAATFTYLAQDSAGLQVAGTVTVNRTCPAQAAAPKLKLSDAKNFSNHTFQIDVILESPDVNVAAVDFFVNYDNACATDPDMPSNNMLRDDVSSGLGALGFTFDVQDQPFPGALHFIAAKALNNDFLAGPGNGTRTLATMTFKAVPGCATTGFTFAANPVFTGADGNSIPGGGTAENKPNVPLGPANNKPANLALNNQTVAGNAPNDAFIGLFTSTDPDSDVITYTLVPPSSNSFKVGANPYDNDELSLNGAVPASGVYTITARARDTYGAFITKTFTITVQPLAPVNVSAPIANDDGTYLVNGYTEIPFRSTPGVASDLVANDTDPDTGNCSNCSIQAVTNGSKGNVINMGGKVAYIPTNATFLGTDVFTYTLTDNSPAGAKTDTARVTVNVSNTVAAGNCNNNASIEAGDLTATGLEIFDGDGSLWYDVYKGTYKTFNAYGCNSNRDNVVDAGDISCTAKKIFNPAFVCGGALAAGAGKATLAVAGGLLAMPGATVNVPVMLSSGGNAVDGAVFAVAFDADKFSFDATNGVSLNVAGELSMVNYNADESRIEIVVSGMEATDGAIVTIRLTAKEDAGGIAAIRLTDSSLGSDLGSSVAVDTADGSVQIGGSIFRILIPLIRSN